MFGTKDYILDLRDDTEFVDNYVDEEYWRMVDKAEAILKKIAYHKAIIAQYEREIAKLVGQVKQISMREKWIASQEQSISSLNRKLKMAKHRLASEFPTGPRW